MSIHKWLYLGVFLSTSCIASPKEIIQIVAEQEEVSPSLLSAICWVESGHREHLISFNDGNRASIGLCQVKLSTARWLGYRGSLNLFRTSYINSLYAAKYIKYLSRKYGDRNKVIAAYNAGHYDPNLNPTYVKKVLKALKEKR